MDEIKSTKNELNDKNEYILALAGTGIEAGKGIEADRRERQRAFISGWLKRDGECEAIIEERKSPHDYSKPHFVVLENKNYLRWKK